MTPEMMYVTQTLYLAIRNATVLFLPFALAFMMEANVSLERFKVSYNLFIFEAELLQTYTSYCPSCRIYFAVVVFSIIP